jgi:tetratricopeptide (TPR) repeat protein
VRAASAHADAAAAEAWVELVYVVGFELARPVEGAAIAHAADAAVARAGASPVLEARLYDVEALLASGSGQLDAAIERERAALRLREPLGDDVELAESANDLALLISERGDYAEAEKLHRRALGLRMHALGPSHPLVADSIDNLGVVVYHQGRLDEARGLYEQALQLRVAAFGPDAHDVGTSYNNLGGLYLDAGDDAKATDYLQRALDVWEKSLGKDHPDLAIPLSNLGELANKRGDRTSARELCTRALAIDERARGADAAGAGYDLVCVAEAELPDAPATARKLLERALALREKEIGDAGELARTRFDLARALAATDGDRNRAHVLAAGACQTFDSLGGTWTARRDACTAWLATH